MTDRERQTANPPAAIKNPEDWITGEEPWTAAQASYLQTLSREAGIEAPEALTKAEAAQLIEDLQQRTGRGGHRRD